MINAAAATLLSRRRLVPLAGPDPGAQGRIDRSFSWKWEEPRSLDDALCPIILSLVEVLTKDDLERLCRCPGCGWLFYDQSRNRSRTWCDMHYCGNRAKARRHFQRKKEGRAGAGHLEGAS